MAGPLYTARPGLDDIVIGDSTISLVAGETGGLTYRGYDIQDLAVETPYESVVHLLLAGSPPAEHPPAELVRALAARRTLPPEAQHVRDALDPVTPPMDALRTLISALGNGQYPYPPTVEQGYELIARAPTLLAGFVRRSRRQPLVEPDSSLGHVANYLWMLSGVRPTTEQVRALEGYFILLADHGMNASTFALRVVLSTNADLFAGATAAMAALKGPIHGGAPARVAEMLDAIGTAERAGSWTAERLAKKELLYGFGHRAYKTDDPRAVRLHAIAREVADRRRLELAERVEEEALAALRRARPNARLFTNVEYYSAVVLEAVGLPRELFTPTFALARTTGWVAHALEQSVANRLIRPDVRYTGPTGLRWPRPGGLPT
ncbi:MAG: citrate synthase/methylcitrate synthase [Thermoplasmata archaeon]|nr:citrate synthase/methylcitrate synthase [Thermoplasmata archaeon]